MKDDRFYYIHMLECIANIREDTAGVKENFTGNRTIQHAVMHNLRLLAESSKRVRYPEVPFRAMSGFRTVIVHDYLSLEMEVVWSIIEDYVPFLKPQVARMIADL